jgi:DNA-binding transcriptional regulator WhiA
MALSNPAAFDGKEIELASENHNIYPVAEVLSKATRLRIETRRRTLEELEQPALITP